MSQNLKITEGGGERNFTGVKRLKTDKTDGGACYWVPEEERRLETLHASRNGVYLPGQGYYAFDEVDARSISGIKAGGHEYTVNLDDAGNPHISTGGLDVSIDEAGNPIATYDDTPIDIDDISQYLDLNSDLDISFDLDDLNISGLDLSGLSADLSIDLDGLNMELYDLPDEIRITKEPPYIDGKTVTVKDFVVQAYRGGKVWEGENIDYPNGIIPPNELTLTFTEKRENKFNVADSVLWRKEEYTFDGGEGTIGDESYTVKSSIPFLTGGEATFKTRYKERFVAQVHGELYNTYEKDYNLGAKINTGYGKIVLLKFKSITNRVDNGVNNPATVTRIVPYFFYTYLPPDPSRPYYYFQPEAIVDARELDNSKKFEEKIQAKVESRLGIQSDYLPYWYRKPDGAYNINWYTYGFGNHNWRFEYDSAQNLFYEHDFEILDGKCVRNRYWVEDGSLAYTYKYEWSTEEGNLPFFDVDEILNYPTAEDEPRHYNKPNFSDVLDRIALSLFFTDDGERRDDKEFELYHPAMVTIAWDRPRDNRTLKAVKEVYVEENETSAQLDTAAHPGTTVNEEGFSHHSGKF